MLNARVTPDGRVRQNTVVTVMCSIPYVMIGSEKVTCLSSETWSTKPRCLKYGMKGFFFKSWVYYEANSSRTEYQD